MSRWGWGPRAQLPGRKSFRTRAGVSRGVCTACFFFLPTFLPFWFAFPSPVPTTRPLALSLGLSPGGRTWGWVPPCVSPPRWGTWGAPHRAPHALTTPSKSLHEMPSQKKKRVGKLAQHPGAHPRCLGHPKDPSSRVAMPHVHLAIHSPNFQGAEGAAPHISPRAFSPPLWHREGVRGILALPRAQRCRVRAATPNRNQAPAPQKRPQAPSAAPVPPLETLPVSSGLCWGTPKCSPPCTQPPTHPSTGRTGKFLVPGTRKSSVLRHRFPPSPTQTPATGGVGGGSTHPCAPPAEPPHSPPSSV